MVWIIPTVTGAVKLVVVPSASNLRYVFPGSNSSVNVVLQMLPSGPAVMRNGKGVAKPPSISKKSWSRVISGWNTKSSGAETVVPLVTEMTSRPMACDGETAVIWVEESTVKLAAGESPNVTAVAPERPVPVITTLVPPAKLPLVGVNDEIVGGLAGPADAAVDVATPMGRAVAAVMTTAIKARPRPCILEIFIILLLRFGRPVL